MTDVLIRYYDVIKRTSGAIYQMFDGEKLTHSELMEEADRILPKTLRNPEARSMPEYSAILQCVVDLYEAEVHQPPAGKGGYPLRSLFPSGHGRIQEQGSAPMVHVHPCKRKPWSGIQEDGLLQESCDADES